MKEQFIALTLFCFFAIVVFVLFMYNSTLPLFNNQNVLTHNASYNERVQTQVST